MTFRDLHAENPGHFWDRMHAGDSPPVQFEKRTENERQEFARKWMSGRASLTDWAKASSREVVEAERNLSEEGAAFVLKRRMQLYDWWLEYTVQNSLMRRLIQVHHYAPHQVMAYAQFELEQLDHFLTGKMSGPRLLTYQMERFLDVKLDYAKLHYSMEARYTRTYDIRDPGNFHYGEAILRFKDYLGQIASEGLEETPVTVDIDLPYAKLWQDIQELGENLKVQYTTKVGAYKEDSYVHYEITGVSGCEWPTTLKRRLLAVFEVGFDDLLLKLAEMDRGSQRDFLEALKNGIEMMLGAIGDGVYVQKENELGREKEFHFKQFTRLKYQGDSDLRFTFNRDSREYMNFLLQDYVKEWEEGINIIIRKIEHVLNNLSLISLYTQKAFFDAGKILDNTFVLFSEAGASQGTAFYLRNIGIITCDHCVRKEEKDPFYPDLVIHRGSDLKRQPGVTVAKSHPVLDIAILQLEPDQEDFLGEGLEKGDSDMVRQLDSVLAVGFPNYNFGDSGVTTEGKVIGVRTVSGIQHFLVSNSLVEGNSGGPALNKEGKVIGIVVTGADSFQAAPKTEKHGLVPINILDFLLG